MKFETLKKILNIKRPIKYNWNNNPDLISKSVSMERYISKSNKDLANEMVVVAKSWTEKTMSCQVDLLLTFSEYPSLTGVSVSSDNHPNNKEYK